MIFKLFCLLFPLVCSDLPDVETTLDYPEDIQRVVLCRSMCCYVKRPVQTFTVIPESPHLSENYSQSIKVGEKLFQRNSGQEKNYDGREAHKHLICSRKKIQEGPSIHPSIPSNFTWGNNDLFFPEIHDSINKSLRSDNKQPFFWKKKKIISNKLFSLVWHAFVEEEKTAYYSVFGKQRTECIFVLSLHQINASQDTKQYSLSSFYFRKRHRSSHWRSSSIYLWPPWHDWRKNYSPSIKTKNLKGKRQIKDLCELTSRIHITHPQLNNHSHIKYQQPVFYFVFVLPIFSFYFWMVDVFCQHVTKSWEALWLPGWFPSLSLILCHSGVWQPLWLDHKRLVVWCDHRVNSCLSSLFIGSGHSPCLH